MVKLGNWIWEGLSTETKPGDAEGSQDGHVFKELDTGESYTRVAGAWQFINLGLSYIKATKSGNVTTDANGYYHVTFVTPFINNDYSVALTTQDVGNARTVKASWDNIAADGFDIYTRTTSDNPQICIFSSADSDITGYEQMVRLVSFTAGSLTTKVTNVSTTPTLMQSFATNTGFPNTTLIPAGLFTCYYQTEKQAGTNNYYTYFQVYKRSGAVETLLATSSNSNQDASNTVKNTIVTAFIPSDTTILATDRLVVKIYGVMLSATANITLYYDGTSGARFEYPTSTYPVGNIVTSFLATRDYNP